MAKPQGHMDVEEEVKTLVRVSFFKVPWMFQCIFFPFFRRSEKDLAPSRPMAAIL